MSHQNFMDCDSVAYIDSYPASIPHSFLPHQSYHPPSYSSNLYDYGSHQNVYSNYPPPTSSVMGNGHISGAPIIIQSMDSLKNPVSGMNIRRTSPNSDTQDPRGMFSSESESRPLKSIDDYELHSFSTSAQQSVVTSEHVQELDSMCHLSENKEDVVQTSEYHFHSPQTHPAESTPNP